MTTPEVTTTRARPKDRRLRSSETRLFKGYGPLLGWGVAFLAMALLAPSIAPEQLVASGGGVAGGGVSVPDPSGNSGSVPGTAPESGGEGTSSVSTPQGTGDAGGEQQAAGGDIAACEGPHIPGDPYSPQCRVWGDGDNGGETARGVSGDTITIALRDTGPPYDIGSVVTQLTGERLSSGGASREDLIRTYETLITYFNQRFEFYGRSLKLEVFEGQGSAFDEILGGGQSGANADAIKVGQQIGAFADVGVQSPVYVDALAQQGVISTNPIYPSQQFYAERSPYVWGVTPDCSKLVKTVSDFLLKSVVGKPAIAGEYKGEQRKLGLVYPESPAYQQCGDQLQSLLSDAGQPFADVRQYRLSLDGIPPDARDIASAFANQGITSVVLGSDPLLPYFMTATAEQSNWDPEWISTGIAFQDTDFAGQLYEPAQWKNSFGVSMLGQTLPARSGFGYAAYRSIDDTTSPTELMVDAIYYQLYVLSIGIHMAGPNLTPETFAQGMRAYKSAEPVGPAGAWGFGDGDFTAPNDSRIVFWDPNATSNYNGQTGAYRDTGARYPFGQFPEGPPPVELTP